VSQNGTPRWARWSLECALLLLVAASWLGGWWATRSNLNTLPSGTRNVALAFWATSSALWAVPVFVAAMMCLLVARHWWPIVSFWVGLCLLVAYSFWFPLIDVAEFGSTLALLILTFWAVLQARSGLLIAAASLVAAGFTTFRFYGVQENMSLSGQSETPTLISLTETLGRLVVVAMAIAAAWLARRLFTQTGELAERNTELEARRSETARAAVIDERLRISRELHDVVAHHISTMTVHAGGAQRALATNPGAAESSLEQIAQSGRDAIGELQRMLGFLRDNSTDTDGARDPAPSLRHLERLVASFGDDIEVDTWTSGPVDSLPASVDLSAYRIVQEALTNITKHSSSATATVTIVTSADSTSIEVTNPAGGGTTSAGAALGTGHGLIGMQERVALHAGSIETGPGPEGGWRVHAVLSHDVAGQSTNGVRP